MFDMSSNVVAMPEKLGRAAKNKRLKKSVNKKIERTDDTFVSSIDIDGDPDDPQMCSA